MGVSTDAILAYGYMLPGDDDGFDEFTWFTEDDHDDPMGAMTDRLLAELVGFTEKRNENFDGGFYTRKNAAEKLLNVEIEYHCSDQVTMYLLVTKSIRARRGLPKLLDLAELQASVTEDDEDRLRRGMAALGLVVSGPPKWLLASYWG